MKMSHFERLPDKSLMPEYFVEIKNPMALDLIKVSRSFLQFAYALSVADPTSLRVAKDKEKEVSVCRPLHEGRRSHA